MVLQCTPSACESASCEVPPSTPACMNSSEDSENSLAKERWYRRLAKGSLPFLRDFLLLLVAIAVVMVTRWLGPASPGFFCHDPSITYPFRGDSVSITVLGLLTILVPPAVMVPIELSQQRRGLSWSFTRPLWTVLVLFSRHLICQAFLFAITEVIKNLVSRPRPCFLAICQPTGYNGTLCDNRQFISEYECGSVSGSTSQYDELLVVDSMLSFPSGHSAVASCTATYMALYLSSRSGGRRRTVLRSFLTFCCVLYGSVISFSRVADHRHHLTDVLAGAALGTAAAALLCKSVCQSMFSRTARRKLLLPQSSVTSNRTTDTQVTTLEEDEF